MNSTPISYFQHDSLSNSPPAEPAEDFYPGVGSFTTDTYRVNVQLGDVASVLRCGRLPALLGVLVGAAGTQGIIGNEVAACRQVGFFPRRRILALGREQVTASRPRP